MKILCNREGLLEAFDGVSGVVPARSPKPIIQNCKLIVDPDEGSVLMGTDLEVGIRHRVLGVKVHEPGAVILPTAKMLQILRASGDEELSIEADDDQLVVRGLYSEFKLPTEDASLFPEVPDFDATAYHVVAAADLGRLIRRTVFATDRESTRYALGGCLVELTPESVALVATDGRRLARMESPAETEGDHAGTSPVIPVKALKLIDRNIDDHDPPVHVTFPKGGTAVLVRTDRAVIYSRLVEGRFPRYQDVFPADAGVKIPIETGALRAAVTQASIVTSDESRGVDFRFGPGTLKLASRSADVGSSNIEMPIGYDGAAIDVTLDPSYLLDMLKTLDPDGSVTAEIVDGKAPVVFKTEDSYTYVVMPLTRQ